MSISLTLKQNSAHHIDKTRWGCSDAYLNREKIKFDTYYSVTYLDVSGAERTQVFVLPDGIYGLDVVGEDGVYNLYVRHEGGRTYLKSAVIEVLAFKRVKPYDSLEIKSSKKAAGGNL